MSSATSSSHFWYRGGRSAIFGGAAWAAARIGAKTRKKTRSGSDRRNIGSDPTLSITGVCRLRVGAGLDGGVGARPALSGAAADSQGGSSPRPAAQTRPYTKHLPLLPAHGGA